MRSVGTLVLVVSALLFSVSVSAQGRKPEPTAKKRIPFNLLKEAQARVERAEEKLAQGKKLSSKDRDAVLLELKEARLQIKEFLLDVENRKEMLPAYDCCPCAGVRKEGREEDRDGKTEPGPEVPLPPAPEVKPMEDARFAKLMEAVGSEGFSDDKLKVLSSGAKDQAFSVAQVKGLLAQLSFPDDKLAALRILKGKIVDKENVFEIYGAFVHSSDKDEAKKILEAQ
jgi:hypothetical protein